MRKIKKINGFLVVRFNDREKRNYPDLGSFGVIDAEQYTGDIDFDRDAMEYWRGINHQWGELDHAGGRGHRR